MKLNPGIPFQRRHRGHSLLVGKKATYKLLLSIAFIALVVYMATRLTTKNDNIEKLSQEASLVIDCALLPKSSPYLKPENIVHVVQAEHPFHMSVHDTKMEIISRSIKKSGCFECPILNSLLNALKKSPHASLIDIGGNIGMYSLYAASYGRNAVTFEPMKVNQEKICQSILNNAHFQDRITLIGAAATSDSSTSKYVNFNTQGFKKYLKKRGDLNYGSGAVREIVSENNVPPPGDRGVDYAYSLTVNSLQGTKYVPQPGSHIVLKVDVEGFECKALLGSLNYLSVLKIDYAAVEFGYVRMQECHQDGGALKKIFDLFASNGLELYLFDNNEWIKVDPVDWWSWARPRSAGLFDTAWSKGIPTFSL
jgi:FkbM family methyltransferase